MPRNLQDLSSLTRDGTQAPAVRAPSPNHWTAREFPVFSSWWGLSSWLADSCLLALFSHSGDRQSKQVLVILPFPIRTLCGWTSLTPFCQLHLRSHSPIPCHFCMTELLTRNEPSVDMKAGRMPFADADGYLGGGKTPGSHWCEYDSPLVVRSCL